MKSLVQALSSAAETYLQTWLLRLGQGLGHHAALHLIRFLRQRAASFQVTVIGQEYLMSLAGQCYVLVSNHTPPQDFPLDPLTRYFPLRLCRHSVDSFAFFNVLHTQYNTRLNTVAAFWHGSYSAHPKKAWLQRHLWHPFVRGACEMLPGFLAVENHSGLYQRRLIQNIVEVVSRREPILIFPGGISPFSLLGLADGHSVYQEPKVQPGAAYIAQKFNLPILPAYVLGSESWHKGHALTITFGEPFLAENITRDRLSQKIVGRIEMLMEQHRVGPIPF